MVRNCARTRIHVFQVGVLFVRFVIGPFFGLNYASSMRRSDLSVVPNIYTKYVCKPSSIW